MGFGELNILQPDGSVVTPLFEGTHEEYLKMLKVIEKRNKVTRENLLGAGKSKLLSIANNILHKGYGFCPSCGVVDHDEDGCCSLCGALAAGNALATLMDDVYAVITAR